MRDAPAPTVAIAGFDRVVGWALSHLLRRDGWQVDTIEGNDIEVIARIHTTRPDAVVIKGVGARVAPTVIVSIVRERRPATKIVVLGGSEVQGAITLPETADATILRDALAKPPPPLSAPDVDRGFEQLALLTSQERRVLRLVAEGNTITEISEHLGVTAKTTRTHLQRIYTKLDCHSIAELVALALRLRLVRASTDHT